MAERRLPRHTRVQMQCSLRQTPRPAHGLCALALSPRCNWAFEAGKTICSLGKGGHPSPTAAAPVLPADSTQGTRGRGRGRSGASTPADPQPPGPEAGKRGDARRSLCRLGPPLASGGSRREPPPSRALLTAPTRPHTGLAAARPGHKARGCESRRQAGGPSNEGGAGRSARSCCGMGWREGGTPRPHPRGAATRLRRDRTGPDRTRSPAAARTCTYARQRGPRCVRRRPAAAPVPASAVPALGGPPRRPPHHMIRADISQPGTAPPPARAAPSGRRRRAWEQVLPRKERLFVTKNAFA